MYRNNGSKRLSKLLNRIGIARAIHWYSRGNVQDRMGLTGCIRESLWRVQMRRCLLCGVAWPLPYIRSEKLNAHKCLSHRNTSQTRSHSRACSRACKSEPILSIAQSGRGCRACVCVCVPVYVCVCTGTKHLTTFYESDAYMSTDMKHL